MPTARTTLAKKFSHRINFFLVQYLIVYTITRTSSLDKKKFILVGEKTNASHPVGQ